MGNPIFSDNAMKLGIMAFNCSHGSTVTTADGTWPMRWEDNVDYLGEARQWINEVMPLMVEAGLLQPFRRHAQVVQQWQHASCT
jgi:hypothetical protein